MTPQTALPNELSSQRFYTRIATPGDLDSIVELINFAFIDENKDMQGNRTDPNEITSYMQMGHFLLFEEEGHILGVIYAEIREEGLGYLALLATDPQIRRRGVGKQLLLDGEQFCRERGCQVVEATVVSFAKTWLTAIYAVAGALPARSPSTIRASEESATSW
jgi:N-acetylglutamate synthase-like GNAT family acetyltransferase